MYTPRSATSGFTVGIVHPMPIMRIGTRSVLDRCHDIRVIAEAEHGHHVIGRMMKNPPQIILMYPVSIPSRGFWFFEATPSWSTRILHLFSQFQSSRGDFGFLKYTTSATASQAALLGLGYLRGECLLT
jgi:DNA-binding NarL/FixJ family response regulator